MFNPSLIRCALIACSLLTATHANAQLIPPAKVSGDWEVAQIVLRKVLNETPFRGSYAQLIGYRFKLTKNSIYPSYSYETTIGDAPLIPQSNAPLSMRTLFREEKTARPKSLQKYFDGLMNEYPLQETIGDLVKKPTTPYYYKLQRMASVYPGDPRFAAVGDVLLMPYGHEAIMVLRRPPKTREPEHSGYCAKAQSVAEKEICSDRHLWILNRYIENTAPCALNNPAKPVPDARDQSDAFRKKLSTCTTSIDDQYCVSNTLLKHSEFLGSLILPTQTCVNGEYKEMPR